MKKLLKRITKWISFNIQSVMMVTLILVTLSFGAWYAIVYDEEIEVEDFGDAALSVVARDISNLNYNDALRLIENGEEEQGLAVMNRLAPLSQATQGNVGNGDAHMWIAQDLLKEKKFGFTENFQIPVKVEQPLESEKVHIDPKVLERAVKHLKEASALQAKREEPVCMLAELLIDEGRRNEGIAVFLEASTKDSGALLNLGVNVANALTFAGDDLQLEEATWHDFATLGKRISSDARGDISVRLKYVMSALILKKYELVQTSIAKFEEDFDDLDGGRKLVSSLRALDAYFRAIDEIKKGDAASCARLLVQAQRFEADRLVFVLALKELADKFPEVRPIIKEGISEVNSEPSAGQTLIQAQLLLLKSIVQPELAAEHIEEALNLDQLDDQVALLYIKDQLLQESYNVDYLRAIISDALKLRDLDQVTKVQLYLAQGRLEMAAENWKVAVVPLELALNLLEGGEGEKDLHKQLSVCYKFLGLDSLADEHASLSQ